MKKMKNVLYTIIMVGIVIAFLGILEGGLRILGIGASYAERKGYQKYISSYIAGTFQQMSAYAPFQIISQSNPEFSYAFTANNEGFHDKNWERVKSKKRIAVIGDSFVEGVGSSQDSTVCFDLGRMMPDCEVMNWGHAGSDLVFAHQIIKSRIMNYSPDMIIVSINASDIADIMVRGGFERFGSQGSVHIKPAPWWEPVFEQCYLFRLVMNHGFGCNQVLVPAYRQAEEKRRAAEIIFSTMDSIALFCKQNNVQCAFVFPPYPTEIRRGVLDCQAVLTIPAVHKYTIIQGLEYFKKRNVTVQNMNDYFWPKDLHPNNAGYHLIAESIYQHITFHDGISQR